jgi:hypothetical protein
MGVGAESCHRHRHQAQVTKIPTYNGGIRFIHGPLACFLNNRVYVGYIHHGGKGSLHTCYVDQSGLAFRFFLDHLEAPVDAL